VGRTAQRTGLLVARSDTKKEVRVTFRNGQIVFSSTNDPREIYGAFLVHLGLLTESDIDQAMAIQKSTGAMLASAPADGFILSRIDGRISVADILRITPVKELDGLHSFKRLLNSKVIDFPHRKRG